tara:strand:- start:35742 stop:35954 length:213 start_codon:yes stop_codon:yes gene_type:complete
MEGLKTFQLIQETGEQLTFTVQMIPLQDATSLQVDWSLRCCWLKLKSPKKARSTQAGQRRGSKELSIIGA